MGRAEARIGRVAFGLRASARRWRQATAVTRPAILGAALILAAGCGAEKPAPSPDRAATAASGARTIVLITIDTLRADRVGFMGRAKAGTPRMDALAAEGAVFECAQTTSPLTLPAHSSLLAGRSLPAHGVFNNGTFALPPSLPTLAERLGEAGYATGAFVSAPVLAARYGLDRGFDRYDDRVPRSQGKAGLVIHYPERPGRATVDAALSWLMDQGSRPVFLWVHLWEPHAPYTPPPGFEGYEDRYQGEVAAADAAVGRLLDGLDAVSRAEEALIVVTSDHGEGLGDHGEPTHGVFLYRETMRVPLVVHGPAWSVVPARHEAPVSLIDLAPTLLDVADAAPLEAADGVSLAALLRGAGTGPERPGVFAESHLPSIEFGWSGLRALVAGRMKLIEAPTAELYDLFEDPDETMNLAGGRAAELAKLEGDLANLVRAGRAHAPSEGAERSATEEDLEVLRSLGYTASGRSAGGARLVDAERTDPKDRVDFIAQHDEAIGLTRSGRSAEAVVALRHLLEIEPRNPSVLMQLGQAEILAKQYGAALETFEQTVEVAPDFSQAWYRLGALRGNAGDLDGEEAAYRRAVDLDPLAIEPHKALASVLAQRGRYIEAIDVLERAKELDPRDPGIRRDLEAFWARTQD